MGIGIEITGLEGLESSLRNLVAGLENPTPMLNEMGTYMTQSTADNFAAEQGPNGEEWELEPSTIRHKERIGSPIKLQVIGRLKNSLTRNVKGRIVEIGTPVEYGAYLQEGTSKMKAKKFLGVSDEDEKKLEDIAKEHIKKALG